MFVFSHIVLHRGFCMKWQYLFIFRFCIYSQKFFVYLRMFRVIHESNALYRESNAVIRESNAVIREVRVYSRKVCVYSRKSRIFSRNFCVYSWKNIFLRTKKISMGFRRKASFIVFHTNLKVFTIFILFKS